MLMLCKTKVAVCFAIRIEHLNAMWEPFKIFEC